jgi:subtilisin family serine protease
MRRRMFSYLSAAFVACLAVGSSSSVISAAEPSGPVPGRFIVKLKPQVKAAALQQALSQDGVFQQVSHILAKPSIRGADVWSRYYIYASTKSDITLQTAAAAIGAENIEHIEPDYYLEFFDYPSDSLFPNQWGLLNLGQRYLGIDRREGAYNDSVVLKQGVAGKDIRIEQYYQHPPHDTAKVIVAIVDTGVDTKHPQLAGRFWKNPDEIPGNGIDDDHNGYVDDTLGYDISGDIPSITNIVGDNDPTDIIGHGTHLAGIVAASADGRGIVGIAPWAQIMPVKIRPNGTSAVGAAAIVYAVNAGAQVINCSWGTPYEALVLKDALDFARQNGVFVAIAAGNTGTNQRFYPAAFDSAFAVAAGNSSGYMTSFSTYGPQISLVAPGEDILSLRAKGTDLYASAGEPGVHIIGPDSLYYLADGTSMASPMVAGAAALMLSFRPDLNLGQLESALRMGAIDLIDPRNVGDSLPGRDTISGYGYISVANSMNMLINGGVSFVEPIRRNRYVGPVTIAFAPIAGYSGSWKLEYAVGLTSTAWTEMASGASMSADTLSFVFDHPELNGYVNLRLTDVFGNSIATNFVNVNFRQTILSTPLSGERLRYNALLHGYACGPDYDSMVVSYQTSGKVPVRLESSTAEYFDTLLFSWDISGVDTGAATIYLKGFYGPTIVTESAMVSIASAYAKGWPQSLPGRGSLSPVAGDINNDGRKEVIVGTTQGLFAFNADGTIFDGFPLLPDKDMRCIPAIYDVDGDGVNEIICTNADGIHVFRHDGTEAPGWPVMCPTGSQSYGFPNPSIVHLTPHDAPAIVIVDVTGQLQAYRLNGESYFYSLQGHYAWFNPNPSTAYMYGGNLVASADLNGDGQNEVVVSFSSTVPRSGTIVLDGRTGEPAFDRPDGHVVNAQVIYGSILADITGDSLPEVISVGYDQSLTRTIWVKTGGIYDLPGWPIQLPEMAGWRGNYPTAADLDLDGIPEIICTFFEYDIGSLYIFRADGTPYVQREGRPRGEAYRGPVTFGIPMVANVTGDEYPEIIFRGGYLMPGTGTEKIYVLDHNANLLPNWPVSTSAPISQVVSSPYAPLIDDVNGDGKVEMLLDGDSYQIFMWNLDAPSDNGRNFARLLADNLNSGILGSAIVATNVGDSSAGLPAKFNLGQNYPNPFNPTTTIRFTLPRRSDARLEVFNVLGQKVATLVDGNLPAGEHRVPFGGSAYPSGIYLYRLTAGAWSACNKMVLVK